MRPYETMQEWEKRLRDEAFAAGRHIPRSWATEYDDGSDGCMPAGWYVVGSDDMGLPIDFPIHHEYGPFKSERLAKAHAKRVQKEMERIR